jgi:tetratricopeptide (TPR) repeat protein
VAQNVAKGLKATLTSKETSMIQNASKTTNQLAYDFYLKGKDYFSRYKSLLAIEMYSRAIKEDSLFTAAYALRAITHLYIFWNKDEGWQGHDLLGKEDIKKGLKLNPESSEIRFAEAVAYYMLDRDYDKSLKILTELKAVAPNMAELYAYTSYVLRRQGKLEESISELKTGTQLDPFNANYMDNLLLTYQLLHQYDNQIKWSKQGLLLIPDYIDFNRHLFSAYLDKTGELEISLKESELKEEDLGYGSFYYTQQKGVNQYGLFYLTRLFDKVIEFLSKDTLTETEQTIYHPKTFEFALIYYLNGNSSLSKIYADSAITLLKKKINENPNDDRFFATLGKCYAFSGKDNEAIAYGQKAVDLKPIKLDAYQGVAKEQDLMEIYIFTGNYDMALNKIDFLLSVPSWLSVGKLKIDPVFDRLRNLPRFQKIINSAQN